MFWFLLWLLLQQSYQWFLGLLLLKFRLLSLLFLFLIVLTVSSYSDINYIYLDYSLDDILMEDPAPMGSSKSTGGHICGRASLKSYNMLDDDLMMDSTFFDFNLDQQEGLVYVYTSAINPSLLKIKEMGISFKMYVNIQPFLGPILKELGSTFVNFKRELFL